MIQYKQSLHYQTIVVFKFESVTDEATNIDECIIIESLDVGVILFGITIFIRGFVHISVFVPPGYTRKYHKIK